MEGRRPSRNLLVPPEGLTHRIRWLFLGLLIVSWISCTAIVAFASPAPPVMRLVGAVAVAYLTGLGVSAYLRPPYRAFVDVLSIPALVLITLAIGSVAPALGIFYTTLFLRALTAAPRQVAVAALAWTGAFIAAAMILGGGRLSAMTDPLDAAHIVGLPVMAALMAAVGQTMRGYETALGRQRALTEAGAALIKSEVVSDIHVAAQLALVSITSGVHGPEGRVALGDSSGRVTVTVSIGRGPGGSGAAGFDEHDLPAGILAGLRRGETVVVDRDSMDAVGSLLRMPPAVSHLALVPIEGGGDSPSFIAVGAASPVPSDILESLGLLGSEIGLALERVQLSDRLRESEQRFRHQALHDPLTGLPNRQLFRDRLDHALARSTRLGRQVAVLFIDLDDFKAVNDTHGHAAGDALIVEAGARIASCLRGADTAARLGGDEFAVLLEENPDLTDARMVGRRVLAELRRPMLVEGVSVGPPAASVGMVLGAADDSAESLLRRADAAMYAAKRAGKGRLEVFVAGAAESPRRRRPAP